MFWASYYTTRGSGFCGQVGRAPAGPRDEKPAEEVLGGRARDLEEFLGEELDEDWMRSVLEIGRASCRERV